MFSLWCIDWVWSLYARWFFLCFSVLRVITGPRVKLAGRKSALNPPVVYSTNRSKAVVLVLVLFFVALWFIIKGNLLYVLPCVILFLCFSVLFSIAITSLGEERASFCAFRTFVRFALVWFYLFPLPHGVWEGLRFVIVKLPGLFSYPFFLFCEAVCFVPYLVLFCSPVLLALRLPRLGKRELILVLFVRLFDLRLFGFVCFLFHLVSGKGCGLCSGIQ